MQATPSMASEHLLLSLVQHTIALDRPPHPPKPLIQSIDWSMDGEAPQDVNVQPPLIEIREIWPPGYSYYSYYDDHKTEVDGVSFGLPVW